MIALHVILRFIVVAALAWFSGWAFAVLTGGPDANIGAGLFSFAVTMLASVVGGFLDGRFFDARPALLIWISTAVLVGAAFPFLIAMADGALDWTVIRSDLVMVAPFIAAMVAGPGMFGAFLGSATAR